MLYTHPFGRGLQRRLHVHQRIDAQHRVKLVERDLVVNLRLATESSAKRLAAVQLGKKQIMITADRNVCSTQTASRFGKANMGLG